MPGNSDRKFMPPKFTIWIGRVGTLAMLGVIMSDPDGAKLAQMSDSAFTFFLRAMFLAGLLVFFSFLGLYPWPLE